MNGRERMRAILAGEGFDRLPIRGIGGWAEAIERWKTEGMPDDVAPGEALGLIDPDGSMELPLNLNMVPAFPIRILEKSERYVFLVDEFGVTKKMLRSDFERTDGFKKAAGSMSAMSEWLDFPVKDLASWKAIYEERFQPNIENRLPDDWQAEKASFVQEAEARWITFFCFPLVGFFGPLRELMGLEHLIFTMVDDPALIHTIIDDLTDFWLASFDLVLRDGVRLDQITFFEDMCSTRAPLIGPKMFREFLSPGYSEVIGGLREMGVSLFVMDTDGNAWAILPEMIAAGVNGISPCEVQAGMDAENLREAFPGFFLNGGIAKGALTKGPAEVDAEMECRFQTAWKGGRYTPSLDHGAPPDIPWANLQHYAHRYLELAAGPA